MTCQSTGRYPILTIGFGLSPDASRSRVPSPPQNRTTFIDDHPPSSTSWDDLGRWDRDDELPAPLADVRHLGDDLVLHVPRKDEDVVGTAPVDLSGLEDRDVRTRKEQALLVRVAVDGEVEEVRADPAVVEERVALPRRAVAGDGLAL